MRQELTALRRRALGLYRTRMYPSAEQALIAWRAAAEAQDAWGSAAEAAMRTIGLNLDRDRPAAALAVGAQALPQMLGRPYIDGNVRARMYIFLAKAAWEVGRGDELRAFVDAAQCTAEHDPVDNRVRAHLGIMSCLVALEDDRIESALAWALQALDVARAIGDDAAVTLCRRNLSHLWAQRGEFDRAHAVIEDLLAPGPRDVELVDVLINGVHIAIGQGDLAGAGQLARRAVQAYCEAPSLLSPLSVGFLFEALACYHAACSSTRTARFLGMFARGWFASRHRQFDVLRMERWLAGAAPAGHDAQADGRVLEAQLDPDLLYLGDLFSAAYYAPGGELARAVAASVRHLLREVEPSAPPAPCEHAAMLSPLTVAQRWFTGRSLVGQAAERVLAGSNVTGKACLDLLTAYHRLATCGASWSDTMRRLGRAGSDPAGMMALDRLYQQATA